MKEKPKIVCLCGSTKFPERFREATLKETLAGNIVLSIECDLGSEENFALSPDTQAMLYKMHLDKIDLASELIILNLDGYTGDLVAKLIDYALSRNKLIVNNNRGVYIKEGFSGHIKYSKEYLLRGRTIKIQLKGTPETVESTALIVKEALEEKMDIQSESQNYRCWWNFKLVKRYITAMKKLLIPYP
jgi:hypothetical protein